MIKDIFKVELYKVKLRDIDNESIVDYIKERADITYDNEMGRSKDDVDVLNNSLFKNLNNQVTEHVNKLFHMTSHEKYHLRLNQGWYNKESDDLDKIIQEQIKKATAAAVSSIQEWMPAPRWLCWECLTFSPWECLQFSPWECL